jgi:hypothetical protein
MGTSNYRRLQRFEAAARAPERCVLDIGHEGSCKSADKVDGK